MVKIASGENGAESVHPAVMLRSQPDTEPRGHLHGEWKACGRRVQARGFNTGSAIGRHALEKLRKAPRSSSAFS